MNKKQTAVEWLFLMLNNPNRDQDFANKLFEKAKEMERQQIIDAHGIKLKKSIEQGVDVWEQTTGEQYFTETYGTK